MPARTGLWCRPDFLKLWAGQTLAALSSTVTTLALPLIAGLTLHASAFEMGLLGVAATVPNLLVGFFAGVWADRYRRRSIMIVTDIGRAALLLSIPVAAALDRLDIWQLYAVLFLSGVCTTFFDVAFMSYLPILVGREHLASANSKLVASTSVAGAIGPGLAGGLIQVLSAPIAIVVDALSLAVSATLVQRIRERESPPVAAGQRVGAWREALDGVRTLFGDPVLWPVTVSSTIYLFFSSTAIAVFLLYAIRELRIAPGALGVIFGLGGVGAFAGAVLGPRVARRLGVGPAMIAANVGGALCTLVVPLAGVAPSVVPLLIIAQIGSQFVGAAFVVIQTSLRQSRTPDQVMGRVNASYRFLTMGTLPLGSLVGGILGERVGLSPTLLVGGLGMFLSVVCLVRSPARALRATDWADHSTRAARGVRSVGVRERS